MSNRALTNILTPLARHLDDPNVTEIVINRCGEFGVERQGRWSWHEDPSLTFQRLDALGILCAFNNGQEFDASHPLFGGTLPNGERVTICRPNATLSNVISFTIRRPSERVRLIDDPDYEDLFSEANSSVSRRIRGREEMRELHRECSARRQDWREFGKRGIELGWTICVVGPMGGGKTDLLKRFLMAIPSEERVVTIEDAAEAQHAGPRNRVNLLYGDGRANIKAEHCVAAALRMRADTIMIQEVRGPEAFGLLRALVTGHRGFTSWHAEEGEELDALEVMIKQHDSGKAIPDDRLRRYLKSYIDCIVWIHKDPDTRKHKVSRVTLMDET